MPDPAESVQTVDPMRLLSAIPLGIAHLTGERVDFVNSAFCALMRSSEQALLGSSFEQLFGPDDAELVRERHRARQRGDPMVPPCLEAELRCGDGSTARVEIEPQVLGPRETLLVVRDASARSPDSVLLASLSAVALRVQRARAPSEVLREAGAGLRELGMKMAALRLEGEELVVEHLESEPGALAAIEAALGGPWSSWRFPMASVPVAAQSLAERRNVFHEGISELLVRMARKHSAGLPIERRLQDAGMSNAALCPLFVKGEPWGFLDIASSSLTASDAAAVGLFASKVASALEVTLAIKELERSNAEQSALQQVAQAGGEIELERLLPELVRIAGEATRSDSASLFLLDSQRAEYVLAAEWGRKNPAREKRRAFAISSPIGRAAMRLEPCVLGLAELPTGIARDLVAEGLETLAIVPLHIKGRLAGILNLARRGSEPRSEQELGFATRLGRQIAIQVENARLYADANRRVKLLSVLFDLSRMGTEAVQVAPLVERVLDKLAEAIPVDGAALYLLEGERLRIAGTRGEDWAGLREVPVDHWTLCGRAALERGPAVADLSSWPERGGRLARSRGMLHGAAVPLVATERLIGVLCVMRRDDRPFGEEELGLLESSAAQVALAIERARLFEGERRRVEELQHFLDIGRVISASLDLEHILEASAASMARMTEANDCFILLQEPSKRLLRGAATSVTEQRDHFRTVRIGLDEASAAALAFRTRAPVRIEDTAESTMLRRDLCERHRQRSVLALPLTVRNEAIGAAIIGDTRGPRAWTEEQVDRALAVARQVSVSVANARLYEDLKKSYDQLAHAQEELVKRERLAALGELSAIVAHEVRNPLGVIFNSLGSLRKVLRPSGDAAMLLEILGEEADRLNRIVGELLDFAKPSEPALRQELLGALLEGASRGAEIQATQSGVRVEIEAEPGLQAPVDAYLLRRALLNLIINAIQAMPRGGRLVLRSRREEREGGAVARIEVADSGPGVPRDLLEKIFEPFFTTKASGTGLGLAVVKRIIEAHRGTMTVDSPPEGGACFVLRLPLERPETA